jgi:hypothetical protein
MVPILIGEPVAFTPGFEPQLERLVELPPLLELEPLADVLAPVFAEVDAPPVPPLLLEFLLLPQPASTNRVSAASTARPALILGTVK